MSEDYKTKHPEGPKGWYWMLSEEGRVNGPFPTRAEAIAAFKASDDARELYEDLRKENVSAEMPTFDEFCEAWNHIDELGRASIHTDIFRADDIFEELEERNELAVSDGAPPESPAGEARRELELMLSDALYRWCDKHNFWTEFRLLT